MNWSRGQLRNHARPTVAPGLARKSVGRRADLDNRYFRSSWEANVARYLNWLISIGAVVGWKYESITFEFHRIKRGSRFYTPDFEVWFAGDNHPTYWEVKGWMDPSSKTKLDRMKRYYPDVKIVLVDKPYYEAIRRQSRGFLANWE